MINSLAAKQEMWIQALNQEDSQEKEMSTHSSVHAWESHGQRSLVAYHPWGCKRAGHNLATKQHKINDYMVFMTS